MRRHRAAILAMAALTLLPACTSRTGSAPPASTPPATTGSAPASNCSFEATPADPAPPGKDTGLPTGTERTTGTVALRTDQGEVKVALSGTAAPCTVRSFVHLAEKKFYDSSPCHRLTASQALKVLQCGDPTGSGRGGPGYTIPDENPTDLKPGPTLADGTPTVIYPRGAVAMANTGAPHSGGSQFFIVYGDSTLPASYAVFGTIDPAGLAVLDKIAAAGIETGGQDGAPKLAITIQTATATG